MPRPKKMKNNASSAAKERELIEVIKNEENGLVSKHKQLRTHYLNKNSSGEPNGDDNQYAKSTITAEINKNQRKFTVNGEITKLFTKCNFPARFPHKIESEALLANMTVQEIEGKLEPVSEETVKMTRMYINFWNKVISKQDSTTKSVSDHQITEFEAGYFPCQLMALLNTPESYLKKSYCDKGRYNGHGYQLLPSNNHFTKISSRSTAKSEVQNIMNLYLNSGNHFFIIPIEMSSKLSRTMLKSNEIAHKSRACNKVYFDCQLPQNFNEDLHPLFNNTVYKSSIELENLPCNGISLVENNYENSENNSHFLKTFFNYPYLSHFLQRSDFWVDDFYARCWHYSRYFTEKLDLGNKIGSINNILIKDSFFKYLVACSARICIAIKYWVLNPEGATYFRCWCGSRIFDSKKESNLVRKLQVGSADLYNLQQKIRDQNFYHNKHALKKTMHHICACNKQFNDHKLWITHIFSTKIFDITKVCPIFIYMFAQNSIRDKRYFCECTESFSDYDFWSFWLHSCNCPSLRASLKNECSCNTTKCTKTCSGGVKLTEKRKRSVKSVSKRSRPIKNIKKTKSDFTEAEEDREGTEGSASSLLAEDEGRKGDEEDNIVSDENWQDYAEELETNQVNFNNYRSTMSLQNRTVK